VIRRLRHLDLSRQKNKKGESLSELALQNPVQVSTMPFSFCRFAPGNHFDAIRAVLCFVDARVKSRINRNLTLENYVAWTCPIKCVAQCGVRMESEVHAAVITQHTPEALLPA
jgi:hypothetical protein